MKNLKKKAEFSARVIAWAGAWLLETVTVYERILDSSLPIFPTIVLWVFVAATYITGILDLREKSRKLVG